MKINEMQRVELSLPHRLLTDDSPFAILEAYRLARTNLTYTASNGETPIYAFTSANANEGKSLTCANLAISFAKAGERVLIIDCDLRNPSQVIAFSATERNGVSEFLAAIDKTPHVQSTAYENLSLMVAGKIPPNPAELLGSPRMALLLETLRSQYDYIFVDLPPVNVVSDALIVSRLISGFVFVAKSDTCDTRSLSRAMASLRQVNATVIGTLLNGVEQKSGRRGLFGKRRSGYGYGYGNYGYGYKNKPEKIEEPEKTESANEQE